MSTFGAKFLYKINKSKPHDCMLAEFIPHSFVKIRITPSPKGSRNDKNFDKTRVKFFPNFIRHQLISHTNFVFIW